MNNALLVLFVVTGLILILFWREVVAAYRNAQQKGGAKQRRGYVRQISDHDEIEIVQATTQEGVEARFEADRNRRLALRKIHVFFGFQPEGFLCEQLSNPVCSVSD